ncbi:MAG: CCA tRNA nucleotidyltransferase, partial [Pseudomonadota bacterium]
MKTFSLSSFWLQGAALRSLFAALQKEGEARVVGGAVRNTLLGQPLGDIDVATDLPPERVARAAKRADFSVYETGLAHGTLTIVVDGQPFEVTTLREDVATDGRRATVRFTTDWALDAQRRDFTMNALYVDADGNGSDYVNGHADCLEGRVRFIGNADTRIAEDHLRILRFFRFHALYGEGEPDADGLASVVANKALIEDLAAERVLHELTRLLAAERAAPVVEIVAREGILAPFIDHPISIGGYRAICAAERAAGRPLNATLSLLSIVDFD